MGVTKSTVCWTVEALDELKWGRDHLCAQLTIETDTSKVGWGARCGVVQTRGLWSQSKRRVSAVRWSGSVILVRHNLSIIPPVKHNFEHNTLVSRVTPESIILHFSSIIRQTLNSDQLYNQNGWVYTIGRRPAADY